MIQKKHRFHENKKSSIDVKMEYFSCEFAFNDKI